MRYQVGESGLLSGLVWRSTPTSIAAGRISVLACAEVVFSVAVYWWIYATWDTALHLLVSACVAPLVLFRSEASVAMGHRMWERWNDESGELPAWRFRLTLLSALTAAAALGWFVGHLFDPVGRTDVALARLAIAGFLGAGLMTAFLFAIGARFFRFSDTPGLMLAVFLAPSLAALGAGLAFDGAGLATLWSGALAILLPLAGFFGAFTGFGAGLLLQALATRFVSAVRHLGPGLRAAPLNWHRVQISTDLFAAPELIPDIGEVDAEFTFQEMRRWVLENRGAWFPPLGLLILIVWALPTTLYRYSLKATFWIYLPVLMTRVPASRRDVEARKNFIEAYTRPIWDWIQLAVALGALTYAAFSAIDWANVEALAAVRTGETPLTPYHLLLILDLGRLDWWNAVSVPGALLTVILFLWINWLRWHKADPMGLQVTTVLRVMTLRNWLVYAWALVALYAFAGDAYRLCLLPEWFDWLGGQFGEKRCPAPAG